MKVQDTIDFAIYQDHPIWIYNSDTVKNNPKRDYWIKIDPIGKAFINQDQRWERYHQFTYEDLTRKDWTICTNNPITNNTWP